MSRVYWDSMLFIYMLEDNSEFAPRVTELYEVHRKRGDQLFASVLALGESLAGGYQESVERAEEIAGIFSEMKLILLPFDQACAELFGRLRAQRVPKADALHIATAGTAGMDLFLTNDHRLLKLNVPGIQFIAGLDTNLL